MSLNWNEIKIDKKSVHAFFEEIDTDALLYNIDQMLKQINEEGAKELVDTGNDSNTTH